jgi:signal transduction histidine kinase/CheY-like chemotaxis protein
MNRALLSFFTRSIALRLTTAFVLFLLPVLYLVSHLVAKQNEEIAFSKLELVGTTYLRPGLKIHSEFVESASQRMLQRPYRGSMDRFLDELKSVHENERYKFDLTERIGDVKIAWQQFSEEKIQTDWQTKFYLASIENYLIQVSEESKLILDPQLDTYYLMEISALRATPLIQQIFTYEYAKRKATNRNVVDQTDLANNEGKLKTLQHEFNQAFASALKAGSQSYKTELLRRMNLDVQASIDRLIATESVYDAQVASRAARQSILRAALMANDELATLLHRRIERIVGNQQMVLFGASILFLCSVVLALSVLKGGIVTPLADLTEAMKSVAGGNLKVEPPSRTRADEIGDMARALEVFRENAVARIQAEHAASAKAEFLAVMSHEIRTPMNGVMGMTQALASTRLEAPQRKMLEVIQESGDTLLALLNDILDMSKIEAGKLELEQIAFEPRRLLQSARDLFDERASQKGLQIVTEVTANADKWRVGDPARLRQVVFNLVSNAIKFTQTGVVTLRLDTNVQGDLVISVTDTGIGIPHDRLLRLFSKFTQVDSSHTRVYGGTGLGLSIAKAIIEAMGGDIRVESEIGVGSTFSICIPLEVTQARVGQEASPIPPPPLPIYREISGQEDSEACEESIRVLVAEDNPTNRFVLQTLLEGIGIVPVFTENGQEAIDAWTQEAFDVILMDMQMPIMDGLTAIRCIRQAEGEKSLPRIPIVALTANAMGHQIHEQMEAGADAHAAKPIQLPGLIAAIEEAIDRCDVINSGHLSAVDSAQLSSAAADKAA